MTVEAEKFTKESRSLWIVLITAAYLGMVVMGGFAIATVCLAMIATVSALIYAVGESMWKDGYELPASRKTCLVARRDTFSSDATPSPVLDLHAADRAA